MISQLELLKWKKKRTSTYCVFLLLYFLIGLEFGSINATLWIYVSTVLKTGNDKFYYGLINAGFFIPSLFFPPVVSRFVDKTRRVKLCLIIIINLSIAGSCLYTIHFSPIFPFLGRFLSGFGIAMSPLIVSEVARSYKKAELMQRLPALNGSRMFGYAFGPCISIFFMKTNFMIGSIRITYANIIGPILFVISFVLLFAVVFFTHDLSREYDLKADTMDKLEEENYKISSNISTLNTLKKIFKTTDTCLVIVMCLFFGIMDQTMFRTVPILIINNLHFKYVFLNGSLVGFAVLNSILIFALVYWKMSNNDVYLTGIASFISIILTTFLLFLLYHRVGSVVAWCITIFLTMCMLVLFMLSDQTFTVVICAKLANSCNQGFLEGIRIVFIQTGRIIGGLFLGIYYGHMNVCYPVVNVVAILFLTIVISRKRTLSNPVPVI